VAIQNITEIVEDERKRVVRFVDEKKPHYEVRAFFISNQVKDYLIVGFNLVQVDQIKLAEDGARFYKVHG